MEASLCSAVHSTAQQQQSSFSSTSSNSSAAHINPLRPQHKAAILHVRENSLDELEALFDPSKWPVKRHQQQQNLPPLHKRNLPASFFQPPETGTKTPRNGGSAQHSRQGSMDQTYATAGQHHHQNNIMMLNKQHHMLLHQKLSSLSNNNSHLRSISEPVNLPPHAYNGLILQQQQQNFPNINANDSQISNLPFGWQTARTNDGHVYFIKYESYSIFILE